MDLGQIEKLTTDYASQKNALDAIIAEISAETEGLKRKYQLRLRRAISEVTKRYEVLYRAIGENPGLFAKPKTQIFEGIKVGYSAGKGRLEVNDEEQTISLIEKKLQSKADLLIKTTKTLVKDAVKQLSDEERAKINAAIVGKENKVVITSVDGAADKILNSLIKISVEELKEELEAAA
ncbi:MAG: hypothetical protein M0Z71_12530 [Nitrospiraceae bacterium]|nr:hypothetical protein [Nitrospiraceae bacterium]